MSEHVRATVRTQTKAIEKTSAKSSALQRAAVTTTPVNDIPPVVYEVLRSPGQPLDPDAKGYMESRFGHDFSSVRVHTDARAAESARSVNARAYTIGQDVAFGEGQYTPGTTTGKLLLAHELTHTIQQSQSGNGGQAVQGKLQVNMPGDIYEQEADMTARQVTTNPGYHVFPAQITTLSSPSVSLVQREPATATAGQPLTFNITGNDQQSLVDTMNIVQNMKDMGNGQYTTEFRGKPLTLTQAQLDDLRGKAKQAIKENLRKAIRKADNARDRYSTQKDIDKESWFTSRAVKAVAYVKSWGDFKDPGPELLGEVAKADADAETARKALDGNNFVEAAHLLAESEASALKAQKMWEAYFEGIIGAGESTITILEYTRDASFITLGILATIATAGAAAGATTTVFGLEVGTASAANLIATGAPIVATLGEAGMRVALGEKVDWTKVAVDVAVNLILSKFGGKLGDGILKAFLNNPETKSIGRVVLERLIHSAISHASGTAFTTSVNAIYSRLKGQNVTWEQFVDDLIKQLSDPKGWLITAVMAGVTAHAEVKYGGGHGSSTPPKTDKTPPAGVQRPATPKTAQSEGKVIPITHAHEPTGTPTRLKPGQRDVTSLDEFRQRQQTKSSSTPDREAQSQVKPVAAVQNQEQPMKLAAGAEHLTGQSTGGRQPTVASASKGGIHEDVQELFNEAQQMVPQNTDSGPLPEGTHAKSTTTKPRTSASNSEADILRAALAKKGIQVPPDHDPHHIVATNDDRAKIAREILRKEKIDLNSVENAAVLPKTSEGTITQGATRHETVHTDTYYKEVNRRLLRAAREGNVYEELVKIQQLINDGKFPH